MTDKSAFTKEEWFLLHSTPTMVGMVVMAADQSGFWGTTKESVAIPTGMAAGARDYAGNALIQALLREKEDPEGGKVKDSYKDLKNEIKNEADIEKLTADVMDNCRKVADLLEAKVPAGESAEYKAWVMGVAQKVAEAAKESSSKGTGRGKVSADEEALIDKIGEALRIETAAA